MPRGQSGPCGLLWDRVCLPGSFTVALRIRALGEGSREQVACGLEEHTLWLTQPVSLTTLGWGWGWGV